MLILQQRFRSKEHNVFTKEVNKIAVSANNDKRIQPINSAETYTYGTSKDLSNEHTTLIRCQYSIDTSKKISTNFYVILTNFLDVISMSKN